MVERPIKKSERQAVAEAGNVGEEGTETQQLRAIESTQSEERAKPKPRLEKDKTKEHERGRGGQQKDDRASKSPANLALMRGPKPTKPKPPVVEAEPEETTEDLDNPATESEET